MKNHHRGDDQVVIELCPDSTDFQPIEMPIVRLSGTFFFNFFYFFT